jgi:hypothetical protein
MKIFIYFVNYPVLTDSQRASYYSFMKCCWGFSSWNCCKSYIQIDKSMENYILFSILRPHMLKLFPHFRIHLLQFPEICDCSVYSNVDRFLRGNMIEELMISEVAHWWKKFTKKPDLKYAHVRLPVHGDWMGFLVPYEMFMIAAHNFCKRGESVTKIGNG